jgi:hypothetical protein
VNVSTWGRGQRSVNFTLAEASLKKLALASVLGASLGLTACSSAPSAADIQSALTARFGDEKIVKDMVGEVNLIGCTKAELGGYHCDWTSGMGAGSGRFAKTDKGWAFVGP